jgi:hypothetical protein
MSAEERAPGDRRWLDWAPSGPIIANPPKAEPTKPSKPSSVGFEGAFQSPATVVGPKMGGQTSRSSRVAEQGEQARCAVDCAPEQEGMSWFAWQAATLNRLFLEQGVTGQPGRITAETVRHGQTGVAGRK